MAGEWQSSTLGAATDFLSGGTPSKANPAFWNGNVPWLSAKDMKEFRVFDTEDHVTELGAENGTKLVPAGTVFLLTRGMTLLNDVPVCVAQRAMTFNQDVKALRVRSGVCNEYLAYLLLYLKPRLLEMVDLAGHGTGRLNTDELKSIGFRMPDDENEQRAIAHILGTLDDKIELNQKMNETLEAITRAIFKSWFVDFDPVRAKASGEPPEVICRRLGLTPTLLAFFPDRLVDSELGEIPDGWSVQPLSQMAERISKGTTPTNQDIAGATDTPSVPFIKVKDINDRGEIIRDGLELIPESVHKGALKRSILEAGDILFSIAGTIGRVAVVEPDLANSNTNQAVAFVRLKNKSAHLGLCQQHLLSDRIQESASASIVQAVQANVSLASLGALEIVVPQADVLELWNQTFGGLFNKKSICAAESRTLAAVRDALLPKLLSGELRVSLEGAA
jgi:type I restriction enzyme S subunit